MAPTWPGYDVWTGRARRELTELEHAVRAARDALAASARVEWVSDAADRFLDLLGEESARLAAVEAAVPSIAAAVLHHTSAADRRAAAGPVDDLTCRP